MRENRTSGSIRGGWVEIVYGSAIYAPVGNCWITLASLRRSRTSRLLYRSNRRHEPAAKP